MQQHDRWLAEMAEIVEWMGRMLMTVTSTCSSRGVVRSSKIPLDFVYSGNTYALATWSYFSKLTRSPRIRIQRPFKCEFQVVSKVSL
jgi:hypothetical protein